MNRLAPLIERAPPRSGPARLWSIGTAGQAAAVTATDARLFLTAFLAGLVFFGTFLA
jgi:hypothetical protein